MRRAGTLSYKKPPRTVYAPTYLNKNPIKRDVCNYGLLHTDCHILIGPNNIKMCSTLYVGKRTPNSDISPNTSFKLRRHLPLYGADVFYLAVI